MTRSLLNRLVPVVVFITVSAQLYSEESAVLKEYTYYSLNGHQKIVVTYDLKKNSPFWNPGQGKIPLDMLKAIKLSKEHLKNTYKLSETESFHLTSANLDRAIMSYDLKDKEMCRNWWVWVMTYEWQDSSIRYRSGQHIQAMVVITLDGKIIEPVKPASSEEPKEDESKQQ